MHKKIALAFGEIMLYNFFKHYFNARIYII